MESKLLKLSKSNALIKKMVATETVGCVSVICSDKTGTLTQNRMTLTKAYVDGEDKEELISMLKTEIKNKSYEELCVVINKKSAKSVYDFFHKIL